MPFTTSQAFARSLAFALVLGFPACTKNPYLSSETRSSGNLSDETVVRHASTDALGIEHGELIIGNDAAFRSKLELIRNAESSIDVMYFIYSDDYSSSVLTAALIDAANRGVKVRLLLDYQANYKNLDYFSMMEKRGSAGAGTLEVRFYNRPTRNIIIDAAYLTMGCGKASAGQCSEEKFSNLEKAFADERIGGAPAAELNISNLNVANSGLFLSGYYSKQPDLMTLAVVRGQKIDTSSLSEGEVSPTAEEKEQFERLAKIYWASRVDAPFQRLVAKVQLSIAFALYGETLNPIHDAFTGYFPVEVNRSKETDRDWEYVTDFLHHKLLLADAERVQLGGRNVEDSYHMRPNALVEKYVFMDTDIKMILASGGEQIRTAFERLWSFQPMVATISEIRKHAPNYWAANAGALSAAERACEDIAGTVQREACVDEEFGSKALGLVEREAHRYWTMRERADRYQKEYPFVDDPDSSAVFEVDPGALLVYVENLPFHGGPGENSAQRSYGAGNGKEALDGKRIHAMWIAGMENACRTATATNPTRVILHNAYFAPPSNIAIQLARMIDGTLDCRYVTVTILTNSLETTDLAPVNFLARHSVKAFEEYYDEHKNPAKAARIQYFEYLPVQGQTVVSLHSKVSVLGGDLMVGSANADVRSYMMDSNNSVFIRDAPALIQGYVDYVDGILRDSDRARDVTGHFTAATREAIVAEDRKTFQSLIDKYDARRWLDAGQVREAETRLIESLNRAYSLTRESLKSGSETEDPAEAFNRTFKPI